MDVLYLSSHDLRGFVWFRPQQIATRLALNHRVLYVEPTRAVKWRKPWRWFYLTRETKNLFVFSPVVLPGIRLSGILRKINQRILGWSIRRILKRLNMKPEVNIIATPFMAEFAKRFGERVAVYDCNDDWMSIPRLPVEFLETEERKLLKTADIVFVTSEQLLRSKSRYNSNIHLLPSGADIDLIERCLHKNNPVPADIAWIPKPVIGTIGSVNATKDDLELLDKIAGLRPDWSLVVVGPVMDDVNLDDYPALKRRAFFLGAKNREELPEYIKAFDVCLLAYKRNGFTRSVNPTKLFEYLSAGKPVVATPLEDIQRFNGIISLAEDCENFIKAIEDMLAKQENTEAEMKRMETGRAFSWDKIVSRFENLLFETGDIVR